MQNRTDIFFLWQNLSLLSVLEIYLHYITYVVYFRCVFRLILYPSSAMEMSHDQGLTNQGPPRTVTTGSALEMGMLQTLG